MLSMTPTMRALAGALVALLLTSVSYLGARIALGALDEHYTVSVELGDLGQGVVTGTDVKIRGVRVGSVSGVELTDDYRAVAELVMDEGTRVPERSTFMVTGKTLLGEKQIEVVFDGAVEEGPFLADGTLVADPSRVVEVEDVLAALAEITTSIDPDDLATIFDDFFGTFEGMGPTIAKGIDQGSRAADVFARTLPDQITGTRALSQVAEAIGPTGEDFNRLGRNVVEGMPALSGNQEGLRRFLDSLGGAAKELGTAFRVARPDIDRLLVGGDNILRVLHHYRLEIGQVVDGLVVYTSKFGPGFTNPGVTGQAAYFQIILEGEDFQGQFCAGMPEQMREQFPFCQPGAAAQGQVHAAIPRDLARPEVPRPQALDQLLRRALQGATPGGEGA